MMNETSRCTTSVLSLLVRPLSRMFLAQHGLLMYALARLNVRVPKALGCLSTMCAKTHEIPSECIESTLYAGGRIAVAIDRLKVSKLQPESLASAAL